MRGKEEEYERQSGRIKIRRDGRVRNEGCRYQNARAKTDKIKVLNRKEMDGRKIITTDHRTKMCR